MNKDRTIIVSAKEINKRCAAGKLLNKDKIIEYCDKVGVLIPFDYWDEIEKMAERGENNGNY